MVSIFRRIKGFLTNTCTVCKKEGVLAGLCFVIEVSPFAYWYQKLFRSHRKFQFQGESYPYFYHPYNVTWRNERCVEISLARKVLEGKRILEVGNVLSHYFPVSHDVLDKYEKGNGVINEDVVTFKPGKQYDLIVSVSTLEHVGWDEKPRTRMKILPALKNLESLLAPKGNLFVTLPLGYNKDIDTLVKQGKLPFTKQFYLQRVSTSNIWREVTKKDVANAKYGKRFPFANELLIGIYEK